MSIQEDMIYMNISEDIHYGNILWRWSIQCEEDDQMNTVKKPVILIPETLREWEPTWKSEEDSGNDNQADIFWRHGVDHEPRFVLMGSSSRCSQRRSMQQEWGRLHVTAKKRMGLMGISECLWDCSNAGHRGDVQTSCTVESTGPT